MAGTITTDGPAMTQGSGPALIMWARTGLLLVSAALMMVDLYLIFLWAPTAEFEGDVQRIFYVHIPLAWIAFLAFLPRVGGQHSLSVETQPPLGRAGPRIRRDRRHPS